ncbi:MAG: pectate lyase [Nitrospirales bacterium]|nr:MAG: pectate lyase [Nitrospirales bacterium]
MPLAFPSAQGFASTTTTGGRAGSVLFVTNLNDAGAGSFREACTAAGPRTVLFSVSGEILLLSKLTINTDDITIYGSSAPGDGVVIHGEINIECSNVILRHLRIRPGEGGTIPNVNPDSRDAIQVVGNTINNLVIDHCSLSWGNDETLSFFNVDNLNATVQWTIVSESLRNPTPPHSEGQHGKGMLVGSSSVNLTIHHSLLAHHTDRNPSTTSGTCIDFVNNVVYNYGSPHNVRASSGVLHTNVVKNHYISGLDDNGKGGAVRLRGGDADTLSSNVFLLGNRHATHRPNDTFPEEDIIYRSGSSPHFPVTTTRIAAPSLTESDADQAKVDVLGSCGAIQPVRDVIDARIIADVSNGTGRWIDTESDVGGFQTLTGGNLPLDTSGDGIADSWKLSHGLPVGVNHAQVLAASGYTHLENYQNELAGDTIPSGDYQSGGGTMPWPNASDLTQLTAINDSTEQFFATQSLNPMESCVCTVHLQFPTGATDDAIVSIYTNARDTQRWETLPRQFRVAPPASLPGPQTISFKMFNEYEFRVGVIMDGSSAALTSADMTVRKNGVDASA